MRQVGRPPERDSEGNRISKCLVNVTIPTKLRDFLSKHKINRSQLFTRVVTMIYCNALCPKCYGDHVTDSLMAIRCDDCDIVIKYNKCQHCETQYNKQNLPLGLKNSSEVGCETCVNSKTAEFYATN